MRCNKIAILSILMICLSFAGQARGQGAVGLKNRRISLSMKQQPVGKVITYLMQKYQIPVGFEESTLDGGHGKYDFYTNIPTDLGRIARDGTIDDDTQEMNSTSSLLTVDFDGKELSLVLDSIVAQMNGYQWEINDEVVNIFPLKGRESKIKTLLETKISHFELPLGKTVFDVSSRIGALPEFRNWLATNNVKYSPFREGSLYQLDDQYHNRAVLSEINLTDITFRKLLNEITRAKGGAWRIFFKVTRKNGDQFIDLDI